jgi:threonine aldolase
MLENTHNRRGGNAITLDEMQQMTDVARRHGLAVHLDGARIFNAATALGVQARDIAGLVDTAQFCLSKGLSAPVGSILVGSKEFIGRAAKIKKMVGGDLRQAGVLAAAGIVALEKMSKRLGEDHANAAVLREALSHMPGLVIDQPPHPTNMVFIDPSGLGMTAEQAAEKLREHGILAATYGSTRMRLVTHRHIGPQEIEAAAAAFEALSAAHSVN